MNLIHTYTTAGGEIDALANPKNPTTVVLRSRVNGEILQVATEAKHFLDCGLDPKPVVDAVAKIAIDYAQSLNRAIEAREQISDALMGKGVDHAISVSGDARGVVLLELSPEAACRIADLMRGGR